VKMVLATQDGSARTINSAIDSGELSLEVYEE